MKTQKIISVKTVMTVMLLSTLFIFSSCNKKQEKPTEEKTKTSISQTTVKPPSIDITAAAFMGNLKAIQQHIQAGSDLNKKDDYGSTPLMIATTFNKTDVAKVLIKAGVDLNIKSADGSTALHTAAFFCRPEIVKVLLDNGADKTLKNNYDSTALESVSAPFNVVKPIYDQISKDLGPFGLKFDYEYLETTRPLIAEMLK